MKQIFKTTIIAACVIFTFFSGYYLIKTRIDSRKFNSDIDVDWGSEITTTITTTNDSTLSNSCLPKEREKVILQLIIFLSEDDRKADCIYSSLAAVLGAAYLDDHERVAQILAEYSLEKLKKLKKLTDDDIQYGTNLFFQQDNSKTIL